MVISVGIINLLLVKWSLFLNQELGGEARAKLVWAVLGSTWLFSALMFVAPRTGLVTIPKHIGWDLVSVTGSVIVVYWLLRLQIGLWGKNLDL